MTDQLGLTIDYYIADYTAAQSNNYMNTVAITLVTYDTLHLLPKRYQIQYIYCGSWSQIRVLYIAICLFVWLYLIIVFYTQSNNFLSEGYAIIPITIKVLPVIRLRAAWECNRTISIVLYIFSAAEALSGLASAIFNAYFARLYNIDNYPLHGCWVSASSISLSLKVHVVDTAFTLTRAASTVLETILTLVKFVMTYRETKAPASTLGERVSHMKIFTPVLFVFYRDGTLLFLPWIAVVYSMAGARLILNIREAGQKLGESLVTRLGGSIQFRHTTYNDEESLPNAE
ncbi:hypothetical protein NP233_g10498 [Leucocoprinus birnbaumii]|uniref:Uncharacterized protein n=1 Tax=Leucocoprinus birnbaumii TaxID=56174 RepID=A0AAD5YL91_9AGAR|nr:hypothetical protein NP233_g10498 [Leucocoprinus birnbaumii]